MPCFLKFISFLTSGLRGICDVEHLDRNFPETGKGAWIRPVAGIRGTVHYSADKHRYLTRITEEVLTTAGLPASDGASQTCDNQCDNRCIRSFPPMRRSQDSTLWLTLLVCLLRMPLLAQAPPGMVTQGIINANSGRTTIGTLYETAPGTAVVIIHAFAEDKSVRLDRSARVDLTHMGSQLGQAIIVPAHEDAIFVNNALGKYMVTVSAVGYLTERQEITAKKPERQDFDIVLRRDPAAIVLNEASGDMPQKARKRADRAVAFLKTGQPAEARKHLNKAYELAPANADLNFLLGYLYFQDRDYVQAENYLRKAASLNPRSVQTLGLLGRTNLQQQNYAAAQSAFSQAILVDAEDWLPHYFLANTYLHEKEYERARNEAQIAVAKSVRSGKDATAAAELTLGQALIACGQKSEGIQALKLYLKDSPPDSMLYQVRALIKKIEESDDASAAGSEALAAPAAPLIVDPKIVLSMQTWRPPDVDDVKPNIEPGISCPSAQVLAETGQRVREFVQDVANFSAQEVLFHKSIDDVGLSKDTETRKYDYVAGISSRPGSILIEEYHKDRAPQGGNPGGIGSTGFVALALAFHPEMQDQFDFDCEGKGEWRGQPSWLVHFIQRHDRPNHLQSFTVGGEKEYRVDLKGRAWISTDTFQIEHIEADLIRPVRELGLMGEHQVVQYGPVPFAKKNVTLWLPKNVEIYFDFGKRRYQRQYTFDDYMLFDVDVSESRKPPAGAPAQDPGTSTQKAPD